MPVLDLYSEDFPHGSQAGYDRGCHGAAQCPNYGDENLLTCVEARQARASDYTLGRLPLDTPIERHTAAAEPQQPRTRPTAQIHAPLGQHGPKNPLPGVNAADQSAKDDHDELLPPSAPVVPAPAAPTPPDSSKRETRVPIDHTDFPHGTLKGYSWGCRLKTECPGAIANGFSCNDASAKYVRERTAAKRAGAVTFVVDGVPTHTNHKLSEYPSKEHASALNAERIPDTYPSTEPALTVEEWARQPWRVGDRIHQPGSDDIGIIRATFGVDDDGHQILGVAWIHDPHDDTPDDEQRIHTLVSDDTLLGARLAGAQRPGTVATAYVPQSEFGKVLEERALAQEAGRRLARDLENLKAGHRGCQDTIVGLNKTISSMANTIHQLEVDLATARSTSVPVAAGGASPTQDAVQLSITIQIGSDPQ